MCVWGGGIASRWLRHQAALIFRAYLGRTDGVNSACIPGHWVCDAEGLQVRVKLQGVGVVVGIDDFVRQPAGGLDEVLGLGHERLEVREGVIEGALELPVLTLLRRHDGRWRAEAKRACARARGSETAGSRREGGPTAREHGNVNDALAQAAPKACMFLPFFRPSALAQHNGVQRKLRTDAHCGRDAAGDRHGQGQGCVRGLLPCTLVQGAPQRGVERPQAALPK